MDTVPTAVGSAMEGWNNVLASPISAVFASMTTLTSTGAVDSFHDSYTSLGGMMRLFNMQLGEVAPGGGSGLYGMLVLGDHHGVRRGLDGRPHPGIPGKEEHARVRSSSPQPISSYTRCSC